MKQDSKNNEQDVLKLWKQKVKSFNQSNLDTQKSSDALEIEQNKFENIYFRLANILEIELDKRVFKFDDLSKDIPIHTIIDMSKSTMEDDIFFSSKELSILTNYS